MGYCYFCVLVFVDFQNFVAFRDVITCVTDYKTIHYFVIRSSGRRFVGKIQPTKSTNIDIHDPD